ncbi:NmrA family transcriptional regulator [Amycolatopsis antarctica]|uniref:NmrA family transcriptional regulator n=1 Tax=Amycolatopsis antarctica TaxID=1854586 RepID=A0A263D5R8_9PSEU|nr:NAD(P)H-binding protein [Amycolatopsis antarctica]OZM73763.1 NmrA family transcriptional regulator [Amycolatopsis antarctica]
MTIVVTTPTGNVGSRVTRLLVQAGVRPTLFLRDPARLDPDLLDHVDTVRGDQGDAEAVLSVTADADALFWVDPPTGDPDPIATSARMGAVVARAVRENAVPRTVFLSSVGAEKRSGAGEIDGLARTEQQLDETGESVLHLRCGYFYSNLLLDPDALREGVLRTAMPVDHPMPWVDPRDIGDIVAARLLHTGWSGRRVEAVHGPADLTFAEAAAILRRVTGRPFRAERIADEDLHTALVTAGLSDKQADAIVRMSSGLRDGFTPENPRGTLGTTPTTLAAWAAQNLPSVSTAPGRGRGDIAVAAPAAGGEWISTTWARGTRRFP